MKMKTKGREKVAVRTLEFDEPIRSDSLYFKLVASNGKQTVFTLKIIQSHGY